MTCTLYGVSVDMVVVCEEHGEFVAHPTARGWVMCPECLRTMVANAAKFGQKERAALVDYVDSFTPSEDR
jgi:hypothetical protein